VDRADQRALAVVLPRDATSSAMARSMSANVSVP